MDILNKISEGVHLDNTEYEQPDNTMRNNRNGIIFDPVSGNYMWKNLKGTLEILDLSANDIIMRSCWIRSRYFLFVLNTTSDYFQLKELLFAVNGTISTTAVRWQTTNTLMKMDVNYPIRAMFGVFENPDIQRIYWSDFHNRPRVVNIGSENSVTPNTKFIDFTPVIDNVYGKLSFTSAISGGGTLKAGSYFFSWRLFKDGYYTDWSYLSTSIPVTNGAVGTKYEDYQNIEGVAPNEVTDKSLQLTLTNIDSDYEKIQVVSFYCNDYNSVAEGKIIYENTIEATTIVINYTGSENAGTVTIAELMITSILIEKCFDMIPVKKKNIVVNIEERAELDVRTETNLKNNQMEVDIIPSQYTILLDTTPYGIYHSGVAYVKELYGTKTATLEMAVYKIFSNMYHYAVTDVVYEDWYISSLVSHNVVAGNYFKTGSEANLISGTAKLAIVIKKYRKASGVIPYNLNIDYILDASTVENEYYNYKNPRFSEKLKGYPGGEKIRFGILFLDTTGRPFFVRHLYNNTATIQGGALTIGPGDTRIPDRNEESGFFPISGVDRYNSVAPTYWKNTYGFVNFLTVSGLDITPVKDQIGAFMIVRCPIERQNIAYCAVGMLENDNNDVYVNKSFHDHTVNHYAGAYPIWCPEDMFEFKDFSIQPGDKLVNRYYLDPFYSQGTPRTGGGVVLAGLQGYGESLDAGNDNQFSFYQKFYVPDLNSGATGNGVEGVEHEILSYTKYKQGDGDNIPFDPNDEMKLLRYRMEAPDPIIHCYTYLTNLGLAVIDINETGNDWKGIYNLSADSPKMLICSIKRPNSNQYGGLEDAALASSTYMSTGHFQIINSTVLNDIKVGNDYIFNEIDIFGGDTFVCIWDLIRTMRNEDLDGSPTNRYSHSILLPIESRINLDFREGDHVGKLRTYATGGLESGLRWKTGENKWEEFNYNDGYSSDNPSRLHLPLPNNFRLENVFDTKFRFSSGEKNYGEYEDRFRKFAAWDEFSVDTKFGPVINIKSKNNNIIYWQRTGIGYIPMGERALSNNAAGYAIQLGVGGIFERFDNIIESIGNSNQFGLIESDQGFHWYDGIRKLVISLENSMKLTQESIVKGLDSFCINSIPNDIDLYDNPSHDYGILGGYDPRNKIVYLTFRMNGFDDTIGIDIKSNKFVGFFDFKSRIYFNAKNYLYSVDDTFKKVYQHNTGTIGSYHGTTKDRYFTIIVKDNSNLTKVFDKYELIGNNKFFSTIDFTLEDSSTIKEYFSGANSRHISQRLEYRNKRWFGNFPKISRERLVGGYVKITFTDSGSDELKFLQLKTSYREMI